MRFFHRLRGLVVLLTLATGLCLVATDFAEARRGGSFGSRGARTYSPPAATRTAPTQSQPVNNSMTPRQQTTQQPGTAANQAGAQTRRGGMFGGMAGGLLGGLMLGGLIGMLMGNGLGGMAGLLGLLLQVGIIVLIVTLAMRFFRSRGNKPAFAGGDSRGSGMGPRPVPDQYEERGGSSHAYEAAPNASMGGAAPMGGDAPMAASGTDEIGITADDLDAFEQLLVEVQACFTREDYAGLRERCTPEIVSFLSEELSQNAVNGVRNEVTDVALLQGDLSEAWREGSTEYATVALRYSSVDILRDRQTGDIAEGSTEPTETVEIWTFVRPAGGRWQLSAIQET
ncbi:TIM44-like domain-containing protein [Acuticoccus sp. M5D2P5]|uniref:Tim44 domain-containing protein n=1 Tax=Acuticoccus kalidii TaxID=2910977 RepID=UPI001F17B777|nr:TIM44-like domain-containing protein [Acuticoccus kalidii]MCF3935122.1 TIM44-like domain-containing protein [Acuticoccus kalidii]